MWVPKIVSPIFSPLLSIDLYNLKLVGMDGIAETYYYYYISFLSITRNSILAVQFKLLYPTNSNCVLYLGSFETFFFCTVHTLHLQFSLITQYL